MEYPSFPGAQHYSGKKRRLFLYSVRVCSGAGSRRRWFRCSGAQTGGRHTMTMIIHAVFAEAPVRGRPCQNAARPLPRTSGPQKNGGTRFCAYSRVLRLATADISATRTLWDGAIIFYEFPESSALFTAVVWVRPLVCLTVCLGRIKKRGSLASEQKARL